MNFSEYQEASFRGVHFLVPNDDGTMGRNNIEHNYPDSETHYIEDNGKLVRKYSLEACLHGPNVKSQFLALEAALETPGPGTLLHPWLGAKFVSVNECSYNVTQREAGIVKVSINCCDAGAPSFPSMVSGSGLSIGGLTAKALISMAGLFAANYKIPLSVTSVTEIRSALTNVANSVETLFRASEGVIDLAASIITPANTYLPSKLSSSLTELFRAPVKDDNTDAQTLYDGWSKSVRKIGSIYEPFDVTTFDLKARAESLATIQSFSNSAKLIHYCEAISHFEYSTADQAIRDREIVANTQSYILPTIYPEAKYQIDEIVTETLEYLTSLEVQLPKIETLSVSEYPVIPLTYQLYGPNSDRVQTLIDINQDHNLMLYDDEASVLRG